MLLGKYVSVPVAIDSYVFGYIVGYRSGLVRVLDCAGNIWQGSKQECEVVA